MAEDNKTSMTPEERWAEIQKWVAWVDAQRILGGARPTHEEDKWYKDERDAEGVAKDWILGVEIPQGPILYLLWDYPKYMRDALEQEFNKLYNKGETQ